MFIPCRWQPDVLRPGIVGVRRPMVIRLRPLHGMRTPVDIESTPRPRPVRSGASACNAVTRLKDRPFRPSTFFWSTTRLLSRLCVTTGQVGSLQPVKEIAELCRRRGIMCHTDAAQSIGKVPVKVWIFFLPCPAPLGGAKAPCLRCRAHVPQPLPVKSSTYTQIFALSCRSENRVTGREGGMRSTPCTQSTVYSQSAPR